MLRALRASPPRRGILLPTATSGAVAMVAVLPTLAVQLAVVLGAGVVTASMMMARAGRVLNPAWLIVAWLYLLGPLGSLLSRAGIGLSAAALVLMAPLPFVVAAVLTRPPSLKRLMLFAPLGFLMVLAALSLWWSLDPSYGNSKLTLWVQTGLLPAACILVLAAGSTGTNWKLIAAAAFLFSLDLILFGAATPLNPGRATIFDANPIWEARAAFIGGLVALFGPFRWSAKLAMAPVMVVAGLTTVSLGPALGLVVGAWAGAAEALRCADRHDHRVSVGWATLLLLTGVALVIALSGALDPMLAPVVNDPNITSRASYLAASGRLFLQAPLFGAGFGSFAATGLDFYPHNIFAEVASELGALGILFLLAWLGLALRGAARSPIMVALVVATTAFALFSGSLVGNAEFWMFSTLAVTMLPLGRDVAAGNEGAACEPVGALQKTLSVANPR